ncbi:hypothetical protein [Enterococcus sp.]|uniref:hypothetical protein n=1 Tax=Enterococcus sp. TaxID=35783 RepID=UPI0029063142|nr:hypothetical protein [Enterococcus sp.]MDU5336994.1 hypothetical protein [Enterococcus sp.]
MSTTADVKTALRGILSDGKGRSHGELWKELLKIDNLKGQLVKADGTERKGVLSGIFTRVQNGKEEYFRIIKKNGKTQMIYSVNKADTILKLTDAYLKDVEMVNLTAEGFSTADKKVFEKYQRACYELKECEPGLKILVEFLNKNGNKVVPKAEKPKIEPVPDSVIKKVIDVKDREEPKKPVTKKGENKKVAETKDENETKKFATKVPITEKTTKQAKK